MPRNSTFKADAADELADEFEDDLGHHLLASPLVNFAVKNSPDKAPPPPQIIENTGDDLADIRALIDRYNEELKRHARNSRPSRS